MQNARENPLAAAAVAAAVSGGPAPALSQGNLENLLDIDFDGAAPASAQKSPGIGMSGLEGLAGTPQRVASPAVQNGGATSSMGNMDDLMGLSDMGGMGSSMGGMGDMGSLSQSNQDILNGFAGLDMSGASQPPPAHEQLSMGGQKKTNEDLLGLF